MTISLLPPRFGEVEGDHSWVRFGCIDIDNFPIGRCRHRTHLPRKRDGCGPQILAANSIHIEVVHERGSWTVSFCLFRYVVDDAEPITMQ